jgi:hypothetical protein
MRFISFLNFAMRQRQKEVLTIPSLLTVLPGKVMLNRWHRRPAGAGGEYARRTTDRRGGPAHHSFHNLRVAKGRGRLLPAITRFRPLKTHFALRIIVTIIENH